MKGREENASLSIVAAKISRRGLLGERETLRNKDEKGPFCQHAVSCHCAVAPSAIRPEPCHSSHTFSGSISQSVASTSRWPRMSGDEAVVLPSRPPSLLFSWQNRCPSNSGSVMRKITSSWIIRYRVEYFYVGLSNNDTHSTDKQNRIAKRNKNKTINLFRYLPH